MGGGGWVGRVGVAHNANTGTYVLISQLNSGLVFATSGTPTGHFAVAGITVTTGSIQVGVSSDANLGNWVDVDDFSLVPA